MFDREEYWRKCCEMGIRTKRMKFMPKIYQEIMKQQIIDRAKEYYARLR